MKESEHRFIELEAPSADQKPPSSQNGTVKAEKIFVAQEPEQPEIIAEEEPDPKKLEELEKVLPDLKLDQNTVPKATYSLTLHLQEIGRFKLLSAEKEQELGAQIFRAKLALRNRRWIVDFFPKEQRDYADKVLFGKKGNRLFNELQNELEQKPKTIKQKEANGEDASSEKLFLADVDASDKMMQEKIQRLLTTEDEETENQALTEFAQQQLRFVESGFEAFDLLTNSNLRLAFACSKKYQGRGLSLEDLNSFAEEGLMRAVERFDYRKGYKFSTFAFWWIRQTITRGLADQGSTIRLPVPTVDRLNHFRTMQLIAIQKSGKEISLEDIVREEASETEKATLLKALPTQRLISLDESIGEDEDSPSLSDFLPDPKNLEEEAIDNVQKAAIITALDKILTPREKLIIFLRFGLDGNGEKTLEQVGRKFDVSRERIRQIAGQALRKLRNSKTFRRRFKDTTGEKELQPSGIIFPSDL